MPEIKEIPIFTKVVSRIDGITTTTSYFNDEASEILASDIFGILPSGSMIQSNYFNTQEGNGIVTINENKIPKDLELYYNENGYLYVIGDNANKYDLDTDTGHLIFTE